VDDDRVWSFEKSLWTGGSDHYRELVDDECLMALPHPPYVFGGAQAIEAVSDTPRWSEVVIDDGRIARPQEGLIVIAYSVTGLIERISQDRRSRICGEVRRRVRSRSC
jgi:hypothetical protein